MKKPGNTAFLYIVLTIFICCSQQVSGPDPNANLVNRTVESSIPWKGTNLIYSSTLYKKELSLLYFTDDSCADGLLMGYNTFQDSAVITIINRFYNPARISTTADSAIQYYDSTMTGNQLFKLYNLVGVPSLLILDSQNKYYARIQADYYPADSLLVLLEKYID